MKLFKPLTLLVFYINFSGIPRPVAPTAMAEAATGLHHRLLKEEAEIIPWSQDRRLTWDDFLSEPVRHTDAVASTSTALGMAYQVKGGTVSFQITCNFAKNQSWVILKSPYILLHEQGHFDITELYARQLYKALQEYGLRRSTYKQDINTIYQTIVDEKETAQKTYDEETDHSRNKEQQLAWLKKIERELKATEPYANYPQNNP